EETREEEEESFDPIPRTPEDSEDDGNGEEDQGLQESSSVSSFVTSILNPISDAGVESIFTTALSPITPLQTSTPIMTPSTIATITTSSDAPIPPTTIPSTPRKPPTPDRDWNKTLPAVQGSAQTWISELSKQADSRSSFNELLDTSISREKS
nr:hypothetical protein [Tanacetum cinerariifolium]